MSSFASHFSEKRVLAQNTTSLIVAGGPRIVSAVVCPPRMVMLPLGIIELLSGFGRSASYLMLRRVA